jgi:hypothetical protein
LDQEEEQVLSSIEELAPNAQEELVEEMVFKISPELQDRGNMTFCKLG